MNLSEYRHLRNRYGATFALYRWRKQHAAKASELRKILTLQLAFDDLYPLRKEPPCPTY